MTDTTSNTPAIQYIPLAKLELSPLNVRKTKAGIDDLLASIPQHGLMHPLGVYPAKVQKGKFLVFAGGRRLAALKALRKEGHIDKDYQVPCHIYMEEQAKELSLAENTIRAAMHPADEFEAFAALADAGQTAAQVAERFGVTERHVEQRLKLARVAPELLAEYREGKLNLACLMAFSVTDDHKQQIKVYKGLPDWQKDNPGHIRGILTDQMVDADSKLAKFVGLETYQKAGGTVRQDLFGDDVFLENPELLTALVAEKLKLAEQELLAEGWSWVKIDEAHDWSFDNRHVRIKGKPKDAPQELLDEKTKLEAELAEVEKQLDELDSDEDEDAWDEADRRRDALDERLTEIDDQLEANVAFDAEQMRTAGCYVYIGHEGSLKVEKGLVTRQEAKKAAKEAAGATDEAEADEKPKGLSQALKTDLEAYRLGVAQAEIAKHPALAFDLLVFKAAKGLLSHSCVYGGPDISFRMNYGSMASKDACDFVRERQKTIKEMLPLAWLELATEAEQFAAFQKLSDPDKHQILAYCVACTLQPKLDDGDTTAYDIALAQTGANVAEYWRPNAANYLSRIRSEELLKMGGELFGASWPAHRKNAKKATLVSELDRAFAEPGRILHTDVAVRVMNWLPEGMAFGDGPQAPAPTDAEAAASTEAEPTPGTITIPIKGGEPMQVEADIKDGLAVHKWLEDRGDGEPEPSKKRRYAVTHVATGHKVTIAPLTSKAKALDFREQMLALGDWSFTMADEAPQELRVAARKLAHSYAA